ncbi:apolipoprotein L3 isoform X2 [Nannospalax galili]|nr:apolipoprotein L3 isoform X2 [Nannospalax galili]
MDKAACTASPERKTFTEPLIEHLLDTWSTEDMQLLLTEGKAWKTLVAKADLPREQEDALRESLSELIANADVEEKDRLQNDLWDKENFLNDYPRVKLELEELIRKLYTLADKIDKVHRDCTISNIVAHYTSAASGVLTILGFALAPVTAGVSLMLSATGMGLGAVADVTKVSTGIMDYSTRLSAEAKASHLVSIRKDTVKDIKGDDSNINKVVSLSKNCFQTLQRIEKNIHAIQLAKDNPHLAANAKHLMTTGRISARSTKQVQKAFGGTALAMTRGARIMGAATAGVFLLMDVVSLVKESKHLQEGAKAESAAELRRQAWDLEQKLQKLTWLYECLTQ